MSEHAVIVHLSLGGDDFGAEAARDAVRALEREIEAVLNASDLGELDGDEFGGGEAVLYLYGADADSLFGSIEPLLLQSSLRPAHAILRYGEASDAAARERRMEI
ncbi:hypothetical protein Asp14428_14540 [Actinoplanes sp. NBRC 14428]|nr:hypothetical protein Asp14428_14540 [Actinoplanes sp. NBRC 14428]